MQMKSLATPHDRIIYLFVERRERLIALDANTKNAEMAPTGGKSQLILHVHPTSFSNFVRHEST